MFRLDYRSDEEYVSLAESCLDRWREWNRNWPKPVFRETGVLIVERSPMTPGDFEYESYHTLLKRGHKLIRLSAEEIWRHYPAWKVGQYVDGYFNPMGGDVDGGQVMAQLLQLAQLEGVSLHEGQSFSHLLENGSRVTGVVTTDGSEFKGERVIVAAGTWMPYLLPWLAPFFRPNGMPVFHLRPSNPELFRAEVFPVFTADIARTGYFGYPLLHMYDGVVVIARQGTGRVVDPRGDRSVTQAEIALLRLFLAGTFPALFDAPIVSSYFGVYQETGDGHFWIAADPEREGLVVATGGDHAFKFAPMLGNIIADVAEGRDGPLLHKFRWRPEILAVKPQDSK